MDLVGVRLFMDILEVEVGKICERDLVETVVDRVILMDDDLVLTTDLDRITVRVLDENDDSCTCEFLISIDVLDDNKTDVGVTLDEATVLQIDGNRFTPYMEIKAIHVTSFDMCM